MSKQSTHCRRPRIPRRLALEGVVGDDTIRPRPGWLTFEGLAQVLEHHPHNPKSGAVEATALSATAFAFFCLVFCLASVCAAAAFLAAFLAAMPSAAVLREGDRPLAPRGATCCSSHQIGSYTNGE
eukprot:scaffold30494_cov72-Phaeocystis_antarctica.AAC.2